MGLAILLGLLAALAYGVTDFLARVCGRRIGVLRTMFFGQASATAGLSIAIASSGHMLMPSHHWTALGLLSAICAAGLIFAATAMLFQGLAHGTVSVVAPVTAAYGGITAILNVLSGEHLSRWSGAALAVVVAGAMIVSIAPRARAERDGPSGLWWALGAAFFFGVGFWVQGAFAAPLLGATVAVWIYYMIGTAILAAIAIVRGVTLKSEQSGSLGLAMAMGTVSAAGYVVLLAGFGTGHGGIVTVLSGLASAVTVLLCRFILKEQVSTAQWSGIALLLAGLVGLRVRP